MPNAAANRTLAGSAAGGTTPSVGAAPAALPTATPVPNEANSDAADSRPAGKAVPNIKTSHHHTGPRAGLHAKVYRRQRRYAAVTADHLGATPHQLPAHIFLIRPTQR